MAALVGQCPGINISAVCRELGTAWGPTRRHVRILQKRGIIVVRRKGKECLLYPTGVAPDEEMLPMWACHKPQTRRILRHIRANPGATLADVSDATGDSKRVTHYHANKLASEGLVRKELESGVVRLFPTPSLDAVWRRYEAGGAIEPTRRRADRSPSPCPERGP